MENTWGIFERFGIEIEYMICDAVTLNVLPIADRLIHKIAGSYQNEVCAGPISYSNELALHVIELKTSGPIPQLEGIELQFQEHVRRINAFLKDEGAVLMPSGMHPWMDPAKELRLWSHGQNAIYEAYNKVFDCRGHGFANLQSAHLNISFASDEELRELHAAIRWVLPIMPALSASSPMLAGAYTGYLDTRLEVYRTNQHRIPSIAGMVIPEPIGSREEYFEKILRPIWRDIAPWDPEGLLQEEWLNSRGAIVRFDRSAIEIRILDTQECPAMDVAIAQAVVFVLKMLASRIRRGELPADLVATEELASLFRAVISTGGKTVIDLPEFLTIFGAKGPITAHELWALLLQPFFANCSTEVGERLRIILKHGCLAERMIRSSPGGLAQMAFTCRAMCRSLEQGEGYVPAHV